MTIERISEVTVERGLEGQYHVPARAVMEGWAQRWLLESFGKVNPDAAPISHETLFPTWAQLVSDESVPDAVFHDGAEGALDLFLAFWDEDYMPYNRELAAAAMLHAFRMWFYAGSGYALRTLFNLVWDAPVVTSLVNGEWDAGTALPSAATNPEGIAVDSAGAVYVVDTTADKFYKYASGAWDAGTALPSAATNPEGIAVDSAGAVYVVDTTADKFYKYASGAWDAGTALPSAATNPEGIAVDSAGAVYVVDTATDKFYKLASGAWDAGTALPSAATYPLGIAVDSAGAVYVLNNNRKFYKYASGAWDAGTALPSAATYPLGIAVDSAGAVYVVDTATDKFYKYTRRIIFDLSVSPSQYLSLDDGAKSVKWLYVSLPKTPNINNPLGIAVDSAGAVYVLNNNRKFYKYASGAWDAGTALPSAATNPEGIAVDSAGAVYVVDTATDKFYKLASGAWDAGTALPSAATYPRGIAVDGAGAVYVVDTATDKFYKYASGAWDAGTALPSAATDPRGKAVDSAGAVYVVDTTTDKFYKYASGAWDAGTALPSAATAPEGIALDSAGAVYVVDATTTSFYKLLNDTAPDNASWRESIKRSAQIIAPNGGDIRNISWAHGPGDAALVESAIVAKVESPPMVTLAREVIPS